MKSKPRLPPTGARASPARVLAVGSHPERVRVTLAGFGPWTAVLKHIGYNV